MKKGTILVAPLNWGLGHATRCIPIIEDLIASGHEPILASDGAALSLLKKEFPQLKYEELPSYNIEYHDEKSSFRRKLYGLLPSIRKAIIAEKRKTAELVVKHQLKGIISDNRLGVRNNLVPSVIITHQINVLSGKTTWLTSVAHRYFIKKFDECWVPDVQGKKKLSGKMGFIREQNERIKYIGPLSRLHFFKTEKRYDILVLLSGPEPQREILEKKLLEKLANETQKEILFVRGVVEQQQSSEKFGSVKIYNFLLGHQLENAINSSKLVISRSGYSTIMDLAKLKTKAFFIPTPGQFEQEYLAKRFKKLQIADFCEQENFDLECLENTELYSGFSDFVFPDSLFFLFDLFQSK